MRCGSVAGRRFAVGSLGPLGATDPSSGIEVLDRRALIAGPQLESPLGATYSFRHALLREAAYAGLARSERARMHVRLARWIEATAGDRGGEFAEIIGGHYASALASAPVLAGDVGDEVGRTKAAELAASWFERAGSHALAGAAHDAARDLFRRSLDLTSEQSPIDLARRWQRLGEATAFAAHMDEGAECFRQATVLYLGVFRDEASTAEDRATARTGYATASDRLGSVSVQQLRFREAIRIAQEALEVVGERNDLETGRLLLRRAFSIYAETNDWVPLRSDVERALEISRRLGHQGLERVALGYLVEASEDRQELLAWIDEAEGLARKEGRWADVASTLHRRAMLLVTVRARRGSHWTGRRRSPKPTDRPRSCAGWTTLEARWGSSPAIGIAPSKQDSGLSRLGIATPTTERLSGHGT